MKRTAIAVAAVSILVLVWWGFRGDPPPPKREPVETRVEERPKPKPRRLILPQGVCRVEGDLSNGTGRSVRVYSTAANADIDAELSGAHFVAEMPAHGEVMISAVSTDGRSVFLRTFCLEGGTQLALAFPSARAGEVKLQGRCVYLETGAGVPGARVYSAAFSTLTGEDGRFAVRVPPGEHAVKCARDGDESEAVSSRGRTLELQLAAATSVIGHVVDENGAVEGARVTARDRRRQEREATTDERGAFELRGLAPGAVTIDAQLEGAFAEAQIVARLGLPFSEVELALKKGARSVRGRVVDEDDVPIENALVEVKSRFTRSQRTDGDGRFVLAGLDSGESELLVSAEGYVSIAQAVTPGPAEVSLRLLRACVAQIRVLPAEPKIPVRVSIAGKEALGETGSVIRVEGVRGEQAIAAETLGAIARFTTRTASVCSDIPVNLSFGTVEGKGHVAVEVERESGGPADGAEVGVRPLNRTPQVRGGLTVTTNDRGEARFEDLATGSYAIFSGETYQEVEVHDGETTRVKLVIEAGEEGEVNGYVTALGRPVEGAAIRARCGDGYGYRFAREKAEVVARSGAGGAFSFHPKEGGVCTVRAEHADEGSSDAVLLRPGGLPGELQIRPLTSIEGRVVEQNGAPVTSYSLTVRPLGRGGAMEMRSLFINDPDGRFRVDGLSPGLLSIGASADQGQGHVEVELPAGESVQGIEIAILVEGTVSGRIVSAEGPVIGALVSVRGAGDRDSNGVSASDGSFAVKASGGSSIHVRIRRPGYYAWASPPFDFDASGRKDLGDITLSARSGSEEKEGGIGIRFAQDPHGVRVVEFVENSPAREAGLEIGDVITAIDGRPAGRLEMITWLVALRGPVGTVVVLEIERGTSPRFSVSVIRRAVGLPGLPE